MKTVKFLYISDKIVDLLRSLSPDHKLPKIVALSDQQHKNDRILNPIKFIFN